MLPLLSVTDEGFISGWDSADKPGIYDKDFNILTFNTSSYTGINVCIFGSSGASLS
jgi:hypothetical protein